ncbi:MAG: hypothetical protein JJU36_10210 [Phycisphaeraceae bacterium]|nr:hypothetical protein [Phycisphaeraceae bacterium]
MTTTRTLSMIGAMILVFCLTLAGCPGAEDPQYEPLDEPINVFKNMKAAVKNDDRERFIALFSEPVEGKTRDALGVVFDWLTAAHRFGEGLAERFGDETEQIERYLPANRMDDEWIEGFQIDVDEDNDRATFTAPDRRPEENGLVRINGEWRIATKALIPLEEELEMMKETTEQINALRQHLDQEDATIESLQAKSREQRRLREQRRMHHPEVREDSEMPDDVEAPDGVEFPGF